MLMTDAPCVPASTMWRSTACMTKNMPFTLTAKSLSKDASSLSSSGARSNTAALLNSVWIGPKATCASASRCEMPCVSVTSAAM
jgi:hypothetical protein